MTSDKDKKRVVVIGGGTGTYQVLVGLKKFPNLELAAVVAMSDSGGSTGRLREEFGMFPPGDLRRALLALSSLPIR
ncbi:YvcK family protein, partial [Candidatus Microgenomates bacterium]|nr:YvcK family protein [Candidatus Microgenomates bacterium]